MPKPSPKLNFADEEREFWAAHDSAEYVDWRQAETFVWPNLKPPAGRPVDRSSLSPRADRDAQFQAMAPAGDDRLLAGDVLIASDWDETEWEWSSSDSDAT